MPKRILTGKVISSNIDKMITVEVTRKVKHKLYKKLIKKIKKYHSLVKQKFIIPLEFRLD